MKQLLLLPLLLFCAPAFAQSSTATEHLPLTFCGISLDNTAAAFADSLSAKGFKPETAPLQRNVSRTLRKHSVHCGSRKKPCRQSGHGACFLPKRKQSAAKLQHTHQHLPQPLRHSHLRKLLRHAPSATRCSTAVGFRPFRYHFFGQWQHHPVLFMLRRPPA